MIRLKWLQVYDNRWQALYHGTRAEVEEVGQSEFGEDKERWIVRINLEAVDGASSLREAKRLATRCVENLSY